jgi:exonuclease SbcD
MERLQQRFPHTLLLSFEPSTPDRDAAVQARRSVVGRTDAQVVADFFLDVAGRPISRPEADLVQEACDACRMSADAAS